jgi:type VI secretion system secreted protein VgrG
MATPYAGKTQGMHFPLLKGTEVLIGFIDGDPDQPIIVGAVPNSENPNVINNINALCNGVRTHGGNLMNLVDKPGKEAVSLYSPASKSGIYIGTFPPSGPDVTLPAPDLTQILGKLG